MQHEKNDRNASTRELSFQLDNGRVLDVRITNAANNVIVVPVPPKPRKDHSWTIQRAGPEHHLTVEVSLRDP